MSGPPASYYLDNPQQPSYTGPGFAAPQAAAQVEAPAVWEDPTAPKSTNPLIAFAMGTGMGSGQFSGPALYSIIVGIACLALPFFTPLYFRFLPFAGVITGVRAILSGRLIGGLVGIGLNVVAGILSLIYMGVLLR